MFGKRYKSYECNWMGDHGFWSFSCGYFVFWPCFIHFASDNIEYIDFFGKSVKEGNLIFPIVMKITPTPIKIFSSIFPFQQ